MQYAGRIVCIIKSEASTVLYSKAYAVNNELYGPDKIQAMQKSIANDQERYRQLEANRIAGENKIKHYSLLSCLGVFV
ncbi:MAG: hypothetical protein IPP42_01375 [Saprospiraceae bacterium]|nr:hypothetical protein [Saprospiraceae bacterium]